MRRVKPVGQHAAEPCSTPLHELFRIQYGLRARWFAQPPFSRIVEFRLGRVAEMVCRGALDGHAKAVHCNDSWIQKGR